MMYGPLFGAYSNVHTVLYSAMGCDGVNLARYSLWTSDVTMAMSKKRVHMEPLQGQVLGW